MIMLGKRKNWTITLWGKYSEHLTKVHYNDLTQVAAKAACKADYPKNYWTIMEMCATGTKSDIHASWY